MAEPLSQVVPIAVAWDDLAEQPWERLPGETAKAYHAFAVYRDQGVMERSYSKTAAAIERHISGVRTWAKRYWWQKRIDLYDKEMERRSLIAQEQAVVAMNETHARTAVAILSKVGQRLVGVEPGPDGTGGVQALDPSKLSAGDVARLTEVAVKVERLARGAETEKYGVDVKPPEVKIAFNVEPFFPGQAGGAGEAALPGSSGPKEIEGERPVIDSPPSG